MEDHQTAAPGVESAAPPGSGPGTGGGAAPSGAPAMPSESEVDSRMIWAGIAALVILALIVAAIVALFQAPPGVTEKVRDVFIIFMALESLVIGVALVILVIQLAILINLIQNELKPILSTTNETVNTLRGTVTFLSDNLVEPVIKLNATIAGAKRLLDLVRPDRW